MNCPKCGEEMKLIPAGISKSSGKPYNSFFSCPGCKNVVNAPIQNAHQAQPAPKNGKPVASEAMMRMAYRKDLMVALIGAEGLNDIEGVFDRLWGKIENG